MRKLAQVLSLGMMLCGFGQAIADPINEDRETDIEILTEKKVTVWPRLYTERDADGLADFLADGFQVLEPGGSMRTARHRRQKIHVSVLDQAAG